MQVGYKYRFNANEKQHEILSQWLGCYHFIRKAKIRENDYYYSFGRKFFPATMWQKTKTNKNPEFAFLDQSYSQFKNDELTPWLSEVPSQLLRNSSTNWFNTQMSFLKGECGKPKSKSREESRSMLLTNELFTVEKKGKYLKIVVGTKMYPVGELMVEWRGRTIKGIPNSITIRKDSWGKWSVSFSIDDGSGQEIDAKKMRKDWKEILHNETEEQISERVLGLDRGVVIPVATTMDNFFLSTSQKENLIRHENNRKRWQRKLARQKLNSNRRKVTKRKIAKSYQKQTNIRVDFSHKTTHHLVEKTSKTVFILENLPIKNMTKSAKGTVEKPGKNVAQKSGLNREILSVGWGRIETLLTYKAIRKGKIVFKINPHYTSQRCSHCGSIDKANRLEQDLFVCISCGHSENADVNAARNLEQLAMKLLKDSGTELSENGTLVPKSDKGRSTARSKSSRKAGQPVKKDVSQRDTEARRL